jgi:DNA polymerase-3 subunit delta'
LGISKAEVFMENNFSRLFGNETTKARLIKSIKSSALPHAFLISGKAGSGKKTLAYEIAMALNCERRDGALPCHACNTCKRIADGNYTDIYTLRRDKSKATLGVDEVRAFKSSVMLSPVESDFKIYLIENAERLTVQAQNALLTFLEEPPRNTYIFLLTESLDNILTTVKSRAQAIAMQVFGKDELAKYVCWISERAAALKSRDPDAFFGIIMSSGGAIGNAISLLNGGSDAFEGLTEIAKICEAVCKNESYYELYTALSRLPSDRRSFISALESLMLAIRDVSLYKFDQRTDPVFYFNTKTLSELSKGISPKKLLSVYGLLTEAVEDASRNVSISSIVTSLATKIKLL